MGDLVPFGWQRDPSTGKLVEHKSAQQRLKLAAELQASGWELDFIVAWLIATPGVDLNLSVEELAGGLKLRTKLLKRGHR